MEISDENLYGVQEGMERLLRAGFASEDLFDCLVCAIGRVRFDEGYDLSRHEEEMRYLNRGFQEEIWQMIEETKENNNQGDQNV
jgi:hypothetical protein